MAKKDLTEIIVVLDRSGSMQSMRKDAVGGFNAFLEQQQKLPGEANVTIALFDHEYELLENGTPIAQVKPLNDTTYVPRGSTALLDAVGRTINDIDARIKKASKAQRPSKTIMVVITDGQENASREFHGSKISEMIKDQREKNKWEVIFIGADESAMRDARAIGVGGPIYTMGNANPASFSKGVRGAGGQSISGTLGVSKMNIAYDAVSMAVSNYRSTGSTGDWTNGEDLTSNTNDSTK
jgi:uncharacterized protein YegL